MTRPPIWQAAPPPDAPPILHAPSLTAALRALDAEFSVRLLYLGAAESGTPANAYAGLMPPPDTPCFVRDVVLCLNRTPVIQARSLCTASAHNWRELLDCGSRPLGELLFDGSLPLTRSAFEFAQIADNAHPAPLTARRSRFRWQGEDLWLAECFLPELHAYLPPTGALG
ncbi:chorismate--pyruvate lyase family protein [Bergeriella denitrificans]|uniref:Putative 4-hydroxybenzoate synthetase n=1 Tax=Bergeriella denitrificans TaxID=494 RepID=A0A378UG13_BERDE|nr:chorismate lyase [Bergeriella denitrificans]STZ75649.1 putative 4-hydroxybenzoate synthetase [Bergeriella denitrificans]